MTTDLVKSSPEGDWVILHLVMDPTPPVEEVAGWTEAQRDRVMAWAWAVHCRASDNIVRVPPCPRVLIQWADSCGEALPGVGPAVLAIIKPEYVRGRLWLNQYQDRIKDPEERAARLETLDTLWEAWADEVARTMSPRRRRTLW